MATGIVKWFSEEKGYGFITPEGGGADLFVHYTGIADSGFRTLTEGMKVRFEVRPGRKGLEAFNVVPVSTPAGPSPGPRGAPGEAKRRFPRLGRPQRAVKT
jgi:CspA family cold shock protein